MSLTARSTGRSSFVVKLSHSRANGLIKSIGLTGRAKYYLQFRIGENVRKTAEFSAEGGSASWNDIFFFDASNADILHVDIYLCKRFRGDKLIGEIKDAIGSLLDGRRNGAVERSLIPCKDGEDILRPSSTINFTINAIASDSSALTMRWRMPFPGPLATATTALGVASENEAQIVQISDRLTSFLDKIAAFNNVVKGIADIHPYSAMAWTILSSASNVVITQDRRDRRILDLLEIMDNVYTLVLEAGPLKKIQAQKHAVEMLAKQTTECAYFISHYFNTPNFWLRLGKNIIGDLDAKIAGFETSFKSLRTAFTEGVALHTELCVLRMMSDVETIAAMSLNDLLYAKGAGYTPEKACMPATREEIIQEITDWVNFPSNPDVQRLCWLSGMAGTGKSAIAHTLAGRFKEIKRLGSSFFFDASMQEERRISYLFSTMTVDLAYLEPEWMKSLLDVVKTDKALRTTSSVELQLKHFILEPAKRLKAVGPIFFVVDAVDESGGRTARSSLLKAILANLTTFPSNFRILVTSRPDDDIEQLLGSNSLVLRKRMEDVESTDQDIRRYIDRELSCFPKLDRKWPHGEWLNRLVVLAEGLFQWAFTACRFVQGDGKAGLDPVQRLAILFSPQFSARKAHTLDKLYSAVLKQKFPTEDPDHAVMFRSVMACVLTARQPLSMDVLKKFIPLMDDDDAFEHPVDLILRPLGSLLSGVAEKSSPVLPLHTSFREFLLDEQRSAECHVDISREHDHFSTVCLRIMQECLRFNICDLETSHLANADVPDLASRIQQAIPGHLSYACLFWADHLLTSSLTPAILSAGKFFMKTHFLHWLEAMSLMAVISNASVALQMLETIFERMDTDTASFVGDASRFINAFSAPISRSAPHTYISALPFAPVQSCLAQQYSGHFIKKLSITNGRINTYPTILHVLDVKEPVSSVAFSPDGRWIASGSVDRTITIWDAHTGALVAGPLRGHWDSVLSVSFSHDGNRVASGSRDKTVRIWDAHTGSLLAGPLRHHDRVTSIAFSPTAYQIASGSGRSIWIWDARTGSLVAGPFEEHEHLVHPVVFSPEGTRIAYGSDDGTVRIWDLTMGAAVTGPFAGHGSPVTCVAFSPDGKQIASGSVNAVRVWDTQTGVLIAGPFESQDKVVQCVAFSHNGLLVAISDHKTIWIWDVQNGDVAGPFEDHGHFLKLVTFLLDGKRMASGAFDRTLRIWDLQMGAPVAEVLEGSKIAFQSAAFLPDGKRIASCSQGNTIRVWDVQTGTLVAGPFKGPNKGPVICVSFSRDAELVASASVYGIICIWYMGTGALVVPPFKGHDTMVSCLAFSPDGKGLASGARDAKFQIWYTMTGKHAVGPFTGHKNKVESLVFSPDGTRIASSCFGETIRIWDTQTGVLVTAMVGGHDLNASVKTVAYSPDGRRVASGSSDGIICIWDAQPGAVVARAVNGGRGVQSVSFSPDGSRVVSGFSDGSIRILDAQTGVPVAGPFQSAHDKPVTFVAFSPDGTRFAACSPSDQTLRIWIVPQDHASNTPRSVFRDDTELQDGWVLGEHGELIFWVPPIHRQFLLRPSNLLVIGRDPTCLDLSNFVHGSRWAECLTRA